MTTQNETPAATDAVNEVRLVGRLSVAAERRELPSGDAIMVFRVVVQRPEVARRGTQTVDVVECTAWRPGLMRTVGGWCAGDLVAIRGAFRRRFYQAGGRTLSRAEVEVEGGRVIRRAARA
ncbi:single-stranded DNA-binding protein [Nocardioides sp. Kera G14]|uniref:single-stranded DNA-binding protein n=1 Tax=Nocardioides sp. Kera G14 TaxID=2884264 RepID=UPI001D110685|nr:single-stranded DNA-binding protein [Nocardioides sp. Kera G14]UDY25277.1 single-stranded DNA-binding protein [Nocardioides sp. Kera G14]